MALNPSNSSSLEQLALKGLIYLINSRNVSQYFRGKNRLSRTSIVFVGNGHRGVVIRSAASVCLSVCLSIFLFGL